MIYVITEEVNLSFGESINKVKEELKKEGFGIFTEINVENISKEKLGIDSK